MPADWRVPWRRRDSTLWSRMSNDDFFNDESNGRWDGMNCLISSLSVTEIRLAAGKGSCLLCFWNAKSRSWYQPIRSGLVTSVHDLRRKPVVGIDLHGRLVAINYVARALPVSYDTENQANACHSWYYYSFHWSYSDSTFDYGIESFVLHSYRNELFVSMRKKLGRAVCFANLFSFVHELLPYRALVTRIITK